MGEDLSSSVDDFRAVVAGIGAFIVILMQVGFGMLQVGGVQSSKSRYMVMKNVFDISITGLGWWLIGFGIAYGTDDTEFVGNTQYALVGLEEYSRWFASFAFCATSLAVVSGALAERIHLRVHVVSSIFFVTVTHPFIVHWAWGNGWASPYRSHLREELLAGCGVVDFAGAGVVHMTGGLAALIMSKMAQPRKGRFTTMFDYPAYASVFQSLGTLLLWVGWYGMIAVRAQSVESDDKWRYVLVRAMSTTSLAAASSCVTSVCFGNFLNGSISPKLANNGALSGLVAISASCATCSMEGAFVIGIVAGLVNYYSSLLLGFIEIDDVTDAIPVHFFNGVWGLVAAGLFTKREFYAEAYSAKYTHVNGSPFTRDQHCAGVFYGGDGNMLAANICYVFTIFAWAGALSFITFYVLDALLGLQVRETQRTSVKKLSNKEREAIMTA